MPNKTKINLIVATGPDFGIGKDNKLLWELRDCRRDMENFVAKTTGKVVVMGRKTYESMGRALRNRVNIVLTRDLEFRASDSFICHSFEQLLDDLRYHSDHAEVFVIGGAEIYKLFFPYADRIHHTIVGGKFEADTFFPRFASGPGTDWKPIHAETWEKDDFNKYNQYHYVYERKSANGSKSKVGRMEHGTHRNEGTHESPGGTRK